MYSSNECKKSKKCCKVVKTVNVNCPPPPTGPFSTITITNTLSSEVIEVQNLNAVNIITTDFLGNILVNNLTTDSIIMDNTYFINNIVVADSTIPADNYLGTNITGFTFPAIGGFPAMTDGSMPLTGESGILNLSVTNNGSGSLTVSITKNLVQIGAFSFFIAAGMTHTISIPILSTDTSVDILGTGVLAVAIPIRIVVSSSI